MEQIYTRTVGDMEIRLGFFHDKDEYVVIVNKRLYGVSDSLKDAYIMYNEIA